MLKFNLSPLMMAFMSSLDKIYIIKKRCQRNAGTAITYLSCVEYYILAIRKNANWPSWQVIWCISKFHCLIIFIINIRNKGRTCSWWVSIDISLQYSGKHMMAYNSREHIFAYHNWTKGNLFVLAVKVKCLKEGKYLHRRTKGDINWFTIKQYVLT